MLFEAYSLIVLPNKLLFEALVSLHPVAVKKELTFALSPIGKKS